MRFIILFNYIINENLNDVNVILKNVKTRFLNEKLFNVFENDDEIV